MIEGLVFYIYVYRQKDMAKYNKLLTGFTKMCVYIHIHTYTGCNRRKGPDFGRVFLMLNYTEKPQNTYIQSSMATEI